MRLAHVLSRAPGGHAPAPSLALPIWRRARPRRSRLPRTARIPRPRVLALTHPASAPFPWRQWLLVGAAVALLVAGLLL